MFAWIMYDIAENRLRGVVADRCKDAGLIRFQKSVFFGEIQTAALQFLENEVRNEIESEEDRADTDSVLIFTLCESCMKNKIVFGKPFRQDDFKKKKFVILG